MIIMNIKKSVDILNAMNGTTVKEVAGRLKVTMPWLKSMMKANNPRHIKEIAEFYEMPVSEFIKVGE